jgi:hypothetical protein
MQNVSHLRHVLASTMIAMLASIWDHGACTCVHRATKTLQSKQIVNNSNKNKQEVIKYLQKSNNSL